MDSIMKSSKLVKYFMCILGLGLAASIFIFADVEISLIKLSGRNSSPVSQEISYQPQQKEDQELSDPKTGKIPKHIARKQLEFARTLPTVEEVRREQLAKGISTQQYGWKQRGPYNIGGRTRAIGLDIRDENIILAGGVSGGMWKSVDNGQTWKITTKPDQLQVVTSLVQDTRSGHEDKWYFGTGEFKGGHDGKENLSGDGVYKSTDNGENWTLLESTSIKTPQTINDSVFEWVHRLAFDTSNLDQAEIYAAVYGSIYRSDDGGENWELVLGSNSRNTGFSDIVITSTGIVIAALNTGLDQGVWRSENGTDWTKISPTDFNYPNFTSRTVIGLAPSNENVCYFLTDITQTFIGYDVSYSTFWKYTYISDDGASTGGSWEDRSDNINDNVDTNMSYCMHVKVHPEDENTVFIGGQELFRSTNGYETKYGSRNIGSASLMPNGLHVDHHDIIFSRTDPKIAYAATDGGISKTSDVLTNLNVRWKYLNNGFFTTQFYTVALVPDIAGDKRIMGGLQDNASYYTSSSDLEKNWSSVLGGDGTFCAFLDNGTKLLVGMHDGRVFFGDQIQDPAGPPFTFPDLRTMINPVYNSTPLFVSPYLVDPNDNSILYLSGGKDLWRNSDIYSIPHNGSQTPTNKNWSVIYTDFSEITALGISKTPANKLYIGTKVGRVYRINNANSDNPEVTPVYSGKGFPLGAYVSCISVDPNNGDHAVLCFTRYNIKSIFATWDGGENWVHVSGNLEEFSTGRGNGPAVKWISILKEEGSNTYLAGTSTGLYSTRFLDGQNTIWAQEGAETIGNVNVTMMDVRESDGEVVVATYGRGIFSRDFVTSINDDDPPIPGEFELHQNYPNPFNPETTISFSLLKSEKVTLEIFNSLGQKVRTLISNQIKQAGRNVVKYDGMNDSGLKLSSGTYIYRLRAGSFSKSKRMIILK